MKSVSDLTWAELESWAGFKILSRGKSNIKNVSDLRMTSDGGLLAWVRDTDSYATYVEPGKDGEPDWDCTCPYDLGGPCWHAVAVVLTAVEYIKKEKEFLRVAPDDDRLALLFFSEEEGDALGGRHADVGKIVKAMKKDVLVRLVLDLAECFPQVAREVVKRAGRSRQE